MERLHHLISKLKEQFEQKVPASQMLVTLKQIEVELVSQSYSPAPSGQSRKIAVVMPSSYSVGMLESAPIPADIVIKKVEEPESQPPAAIKKEEIKEWVEDPLAEIPTLAHQQAAREINDVIGGNGYSLNDKLKGNVVELAAALKEAPVRE